MMYSNIDKIKEYKDQTVFAEDLKPIEYLNFLMNIDELHKFNITFCLRKPERLKEPKGHYEGIFKKHSE